MEAARGKERGARRVDVHDEPIHSRSTRVIAGRGRVQRCGSRDLAVVLAPSTLPAAPTCTDECGSAAEMVCQ